MSLLRPDPTFYPSPAMATEAPPEKLAYLALINPAGAGQPDAIGVVDVDPESNAYGRLVGQTQTLTLFVDERFQNFEEQDAFAAATALALIAITTLLLTKLLRPKDGD